MRLRLSNQLLSLAIVITIFFISCSTEVGFPESGLTISVSKPDGILVSSTSECDIFLLHANPSKGYNYNAYFWLPRNIDASVVRLVVEPNNTGVGINEVEINNRVFNNVVSSSGRTVAEFMSLPFLMPAFDRTNIYTHALSSDAIKATGDLERVDLQLLAMIDDVIDYIHHVRGVRLKSEALLLGYSAGGMFSTHFTLLHPERVHAVAAGGNQAAFSLPFESIDGVGLNFPLGTSDYQSITGHAFSIEDWKKVRFLYVNGLNDTNDSINPTDCHPGDEPNIIKSIWGGSMKERTKTVYEYCNTVGANSQFFLYSDLGHGWYIDDVVKFFEANSRDSFVEIQSNHPTEKL